MASLIEIEIICFQIKSLKGYDQNKLMNNYSLL